MHVGTRLYVFLSPSSWNILSFLCTRLRHLVTLPTMQFVPYSHAIACGQAKLGHAASNRYIYMHTYTHTYKHIYVYNIYIYTDVDVCICTFTRMCACVHTFVYIFVPFLSQYSLVSLYTSAKFCYIPYNAVRPLLTYNSVWASKAGTCSIDRYIYMHTS